MRVDSVFAGLNKKGDFVMTAVLTKSLYCQALLQIAVGAPVAKLPSNSGFDIAQTVWQTALEKAIPDQIAQIRHVCLAGDESWRLHVAEISDRVTCHVHEDGYEVYEIVSGSGTLYSGPSAKSSTGARLLSRHSLQVTSGDVFIVPEGYAHQLVKRGDAPLVIIFACPDSHLAEDRIVLADICEEHPKLFVDADALPGAARDILFRAAQRVKITTHFVANKPLRMPDSEYISFELAGQGFDVADARIVELVSAGDIVVTADIPLAAAVVEKGALAVDPRGELYSDENIKERLFVRDFMDTLRKSGATTGGPPPYGIKDSRAFAAQL
ncbi:MAG TPA: YaiI/YqxD family protein, partial [Candidatus Riflebacteria bacterium]|nr:YaiI/YqxD family protein [Candidatus Riflebacteria bacterium]